MKFPIIRALLSVSAAMFYCMAAYDLASVRGEPGGFPAILATLLLAGNVSLWVLADSRQRWRPIPYDFGSFVFFTWPVSAPIYLFTTRGWRAFGLLGRFILLYLAAPLLISVPLIIQSVRQ